MLEYFDSKRNRILLENGKSIITPEQYSDILFRGKPVEGYHLEDEEEISRYAERYRINLSPDGDPVYETLNQEEGAFDCIVERIMSSPRLVENEKYFDRIETELEYFKRSNNMEFLLRVSNLINEFKKEGVLWGVGRGSSCASLVCYLLEINDVDPIRFGIPFSELSKE